MCQQHPQFLTAYRLHMHRTVKPSPHHLRNTARIVAVRLVDLRLQHRLHVPRLNADHRQSCIGEQQSTLMLHRTRDLLIRQRTQLINALRAHLAELGLVAAKGREGLQQLVAAVTESSEERLSSHARFSCQAIVAQLHAVQTQINGLDKRILQAHRANADSKRLDDIPGFGVILSTAVVATMTDPKAFKTGREFAAWIGLVPRQNSTGGKERLGSISKQGDRYLRRLFVVGAISIVSTARMWPDKYPWLIELLGRRPAKVVAVALANKMARIAWAVLAKGGSYRAPALAAAA